MQLFVIKKHTLAWLDDKKNVEDGFVNYATRKPDPFLILIFSNEMKRACRGIRGNGSNRTAPGKTEHDWHGIHPGQNTKLWG